MGSQSDSAIQTAAALNEWRRLLRYMLAENPIRAEYSHRMGHEQQKLGSPAHSTRTIRFEVEGAEPEYIVIRDGTAYTTRVRPLDADDDKIEVIRLGQPGRRLLTRVEDLQAKLTASSADFVPDLDLERVHENLQLEYSTHRPDASSALAEAAKGVDLELDPAGGPSDRGLANWRTAASSKLIACYDRFTASASAIVPTMACLSLSATTKAVLQREFMPGTVYRDPSNGAVRVELVSDFEVYFQSLPAAMAPQTAILSALQLRKTGDKGRDLGLAASTMEAFSHGLFLAALSYYTARWTLQQVVASGHGLNGASDEEVDQLQRELRSLEEMRVVIQTALDPDAWPFHNIVRFNKWITELETLAAGEADKEITESYLQLRMPTFVRDLARCAIQIKAEGTRSRAVELIKEQRMRILADHRTNSPPVGEPNYPAVMCVFISSGLALLGQLEEAEEYRVLGRSRS